jgi:hypothetical protein
MMTILTNEYFLGVITNEYFWGVVTGVVLTIIGTWLTSILTMRQQRKAQRTLVKNLCIDIVNNMRAIVDDMVDHRQRTQVIHSDYLQLLDIEFNVSGRNREQIIHLPNPVRENIRTFVTDCAIRRAEIGNYLSQFTNLMTLANRLQNTGQLSQAQQAQQAAAVPRSYADQALDQLAARVKDSAELLNSLNEVK